jgi:hypothetical protein
MIKKLGNVVVWVLALNFLAAAGGVGFLVATKKLNREKVHDIRTLLMDGGTVAPATQPTTQPTTQAAVTAQDSPGDSPMLRLDQVLKGAAGRADGDAISQVQATFDTQNAVLERRLRELEDQRRQIEQAKQDIESDRKKLAAAQTQLTQQQQAQAKIAEDKGFQDTLTLYQAMPAKKVKDIFKTLNDDIVVRYLQSMETRQAGSILKEFKTPEETIRAQAILEKMRQATAKAS